MIEHATVTAPEMIGLLVWWIVMLVAPVILVRRWRRRREAAERLRRQVRATGGGTAGRQAGRLRPQRPHRRRGPLPRHARRRRVFLPKRSNHSVGSSISSAGCELAASELRVTALAVARGSVADRALPAHRRAPQHASGPRETGVFVISATYPPGDWDDVVTVSRLASEDPDAASGVLRPGPARRSAIRSAE